MAVGNFVFSLLGGTSIGMVTSYAYYADISSKESRTGYIAIGEICHGVGSLVISLISRPWF